MQPAENEWTKIPNALLENMADLGNAELRVLLALIRKTAGYQKESDRVSVSQLVTMTGLTSRNAQNALTSLLASGHIGREQAGKQAFAYHVKPYPVGTRITEDENHVPSDTRSLGDMVPYPVGTRFDEKPYPLGTTQKKDLKERKKESRTPRKRSDATPAEDVTPIAIRQAMAEVCDVDITPGAKPPRKMIALLNSECKTLWTQQQERSISVEATIEGIRTSARYTRMTDRRFKDPVTRIPIALIRENWTAAARWKRDQNKALNGANGHQPAERMPTPEETAAYAARYNPRIPGRTV